MNAHTSNKGSTPETKDDQQKREDDVLRRMLNTPPKPHKPKGDDKTKQGD